jgi:hypothetical protein
MNSVLCFPFIPPFFFEPSATFLFAPSLASIPTLLPPGVEVEKKGKVAGLSVEQSLRIVKNNSAGSEPGLHLSRAMGLPLFLS